MHRSQLCHSQLHSIEKWLPRERGERRAFELRSLGYKFRSLSDRVPTNQIFWRTLARTLSQAVSACSNCRMRHSSVNISNVSECFWRTDVWTKPVVRRHQDTDGLVMAGQYARYQAALVRFCVGLYDRDCNRNFIGILRPKGISRAATRFWRLP
jgi:hypothetical protein